jgi:hypothetical protein
MIQSTDRCKKPNTLPLQYQLETPPDTSSTAIPKHQSKPFSVFKHTHFNLLLERNINKDITAHTKKKKVILTLR